MKRYLIFIILIITLLPGINIQKANAWGGNSHQYLIMVSTSYLENVVDTLGENGERWPQLFRIYESDLKLGSIWPDRIGDSSNHVYHIDNPIPQFTNTPNVVRRLYDLFKTHLLDGNYSGAVWEAGMMSHYIFDLCQPMHTASSGKEHDEYGPGEVDPHWKYEQDVNAKIDEITFINHIPYLLEKSVEETTVDCAINSHPYYEDLVESYWNGSFWTSWVEEITTTMLNFAVSTFSNILYTAIMEVNISLPDFTPLAINLDVNIPTFLIQGEKYTGVVTTTNWQGDPLDVNIHITRTWRNYDEDNITEGNQEIFGPFIVLYSREEIGIYSFELNINITGSVDLEIEVSKPNMISKTEIRELMIMEPSHSSTASITSSVISSNTISFPVTFTLLSIFIILSRQKRHN